MRVLKVSLITTVFNEEKNIRKLIDSIADQSVFPSELIIVDGGSTDNTLEEISTAEKFYRQKFRIRLFIKKGNRSVGRNEGIKNAFSEIILLTDAGCFLDKKWIENITKPFQDKKVEVVAGYYKGLAKNIFQKCLIPYVLVMKDRVNSKDFLPATRSMALRKYVWKKIGGFDQSLSHNEDYAFANKIKSKGFSIYFQQTAVVNWIPRKDIKEAFVMFLRFAFGDGESGIIRDKVLLIFARYAFYLYLISLFILIKSIFLLILILLLPLIYIYWSINKNYKYVKDKKALIHLPIIQIVSDTAVLLGTSMGIIKFILKINFIQMIRNNLILFIFIIIYSLSMIAVIKSGIPNLDHPFPYQMDEWHQSQSVRNVFKYGTPNLPGSANGTMFHFYISGLLLVPFILLNIVNPFNIHSSIDALASQENLFIIFRLTTLFFGILTLVLISKIAKILKLNPKLSVLLLFITPVWLSLSNFFKYDIALVFWITASLYYFIKYNFNPISKNFLIGCFLAAIALSVKVTGIITLPMIFFAYFILTPNIRKKISIFILGIFIYIFATIFFGVPDIIFGGRSMYAYLYENIIEISSVAKSYNIEYSLLEFNFLHKFPDIFGHFLYLLTVIVIIYFIIYLLINLIYKRFKDLRLRFFLLLSFFISFLSLFSLGIFITANRAIVLLPFIIILDLLALKDLLIIVKNRIYIKIFLMLIFIFLLLIQIFESYLWLVLKNSDLPQQSSSRWVLNNIPRGSNIGLENIPVYQFEPDFVLKEFYTKQYNPGFKTNYNYSIVDKTSKILPKYIIISNAYYNNKYLNFSDSKNMLVKRLRNENYNEIAYFPLKFSFYEKFNNYFYYPYLGLFVYPKEISIFEKISNDN